MNHLPAVTAAAVDPAAHFENDASPALALLLVTGADAPSFLDSQLTRNVPTADGAASLAGYCSPKGRLLATFVTWRRGDAIALLTPTVLAAPIAKRLRMYVLRAKVAIDDATDRTAIDGFVDPVESPALPQPWSVVDVDDTTWLRYPDADGRRRLLRIGSMRSADRAAAVDAATWRWLDIRAGLPTIGPATQDRFVPQMVNLEALGGVDFKKGCFPGQEVVARSQYLGKLKRRMALASLDGGDAPPPGCDVVRAGDAEPVGLVVDAARGPDGRVALLVELPLALFASDALRAGTADGPALTLQPLPYELPDNEVFVRPKL